MKKILSLMIVATIVLTAGCAKGPDKLPNIDEVDVVATDEVAPETVVEGETPDVETPVETPVEGETPVDPETPADTETPVKSEDPTVTPTPIVTPAKPSTEKPAANAPATQKPVVTKPVDVTPTPAPITKPGESITFKDITTTETVRFETVRVNSDKVPKGTEMVSQDGKNGTKQFIHRVTYTNGKETARELIRELITVSPVAKIVTVGTGSTSIPKPTTPPPAPVITYKKVTATETVAFATVRVNDSSIEKGKEVVSQNGKNGVREIVTEITYSDGKEVARNVVSNQITTQPLSKVILVGTKVVAPTPTPTPTPTPPAPTPTPTPPAPVITSKDFYQNHSIPFEGKEVPDSTMFEGDTKIVTEGVNGTRVVVIRETYSDGKKIKEEVVSDTITVQPITQVLHYGTKVVPLPEATTSSAQLTALINKHNELRVANGIGELTISSSLRSGAAIRAVEISMSNKFSHTRPNGQPFYTVSSAAKAENIAYGSSSGLTAFGMFWGSAAHKANILNPEYNTIGAASYYLAENGATYWAVLFGN